MSGTNVGAFEAVLRIVLAALLFVAAWYLLVLAPPWYYVPVAFVVFFGVGLLIRSAVTRYCPIHARLGINTCSCDDE